MFDTQYVSVLVTFDADILQFFVVRGRHGFYQTRFATHLTAFVKQQPFTIGAKWRYNQNRLIFKLQLIYR